MFCVRNSAELRDHIFGWHTGKTLPVKAEEQATACAAVNAGGGHRENLLLENSNASEALTGSKTASSAEFVGRSKSFAPFEGKGGSAS